MSPDENFTVEGVSSASLSSCFELKKEPLSRFLCSAMMKNPMHPEEPRKAYANLQLTGIVSTDDLAEHITHHNSVFSKGTIIGILTELGVCMRELILQGYKVILATFAPGITSEGALTKEAFTAQQIKDMDVNYQPGKSFESLRQDAEFDEALDFGLTPDEALEEWDIYPYGETKKEVISNC